MLLDKIMIMTRQYMVDSAKQGVVVGKHQDLRGTFLVPHAKHIREFDGGLAEAREHAGHLGGYECPTVMTWGARQEEGLSPEGKTRVRTEKPS